MTQARSGGGGGGMIGKISTTSRFQKLSSMGPTLMFACDEGGGGGGGGGGQQASCLVAKQAGNFHRYWLVVYELICLLQFLG